MNARPWIHRLAIFAITLLAFCRLSNCEFVDWDDQQTIRANPLLNPPSWNTLRFYWTTGSEEKTMGLYVPVTYTVWAGLAMVSHLLPGAAGMNSPNSVVFHSANVLLHSITAVLVFELLLALFGSPLAAALGALLFALHPVQVETVGWASGTKDLLCGLFSVASLLVYVRSAQLNSRWRWGVGLLLFVLAVLSKPTALVVPLLAAVISVILLRRSLWKTISSLWPWMVLMIPFAIITQLVQPPAWISPLPAWASPFVAADALAFYACKLVWPANLSTDYGRTPPVILANHEIYFTWIVPALLVVLLLWKNKTARPVTAAGLLFLLPLIPVLGFVPFEFQRYSTTADHYLYLPMVGLAVLPTWGLSLAGISRGSIALSMVILATCAALSIHQERVWKNTRALFSYDIQLNPRSFRDTTGLGFLAGQEALELKRAGKIADSQTLFDQSTQYYTQALEANPDLIGPMLNIAVNYRETGRRDLGLAMVKRIVDTQPRLPAADRADPATIAKLWEDFDDIPDEINWLKRMQLRDPQNRQIAEQLSRAIEKLKLRPATSRSVS